jgi:hypothetical protein
MANVKNLAVGTVLTAPSPATTGTTLTLNSGQGSRFPAAPFYATAFPIAALPSTTNAEIIYVTAVSTDTFTFTRAQKSTTAQSIATGWIIANSIYVEDLFTSSLNQPEILSGTPNGVLTTFTTALPYTMIWLFKNGVFMYPGSGNDYTYSGSTVTMAAAPVTGTILTAIGITGSLLMIAGSNSLPTDETPAGTVGGSNTTFTTSRPYVSGTLEVFINGVKQKRTTHFTETTPSTGVFTMSDAPITGDDIMVNYQYATSVSGNAQSVNGYGANATPTANQLLPLDGTARLPIAALPLGSGQITPSLSTGWTQFDANTLPTTATGAYGRPRYYRDAVGVVHLSGLAKNSTGSSNTATTNALIYNLPAGYRPGVTMRIVVVNGISGTDSWGEVDVETNGDVKLTGVTNVVAGQWVSLNNISFVAEQ